MANPKVNSVNVAIDITIKQGGSPKDVTAATTKMMIKRPDGTAFLRTATKPSGGADGVIRYVTVGDEGGGLGPTFNSNGVYEVEPDLNFPGGFIGRSETVAFPIDGIIEASP